MKNQFKMILGVLVWRHLLGLETAQKIDQALSDKIIPDTIQEILEELELAEESIHP